MRIKMNATAAGPGGVFQSGYEGDVDDAFAKDMIAGNYAEPVGFVDEIPMPSTSKPVSERLAGAADVVIPEGWRDLTAKELKAIAAELASPAAATRNEAIEVIDNELALRSS